MDERIVSRRTLGRQGCEPIEWKPALTNDVTYRDNGVNLDASELPLPTVSF